MTEKNIDHLISVVLVLGLMFYFITLSKDSNKTVNPNSSAVNNNTPDKPIETNWFKKNDYRNSYWLASLCVAIGLFILKMLAKS